MLFRDHIYYQDKVFATDIVSRALNVTNQPAPLPKQKPIGMYIRDISGYCCSMII